jgi:hypothetical protein
MTILDKLRAWRCGCGDGIPDAYLDELAIALAISPPSGGLWLSLDESNSEAWEVECDGTEEDVDDQPLECVDGFLCYAGDLGIRAKGAQCLDNPEDELSPMPCPHCNGTGKLRKRLVGCVLADITFCVDFNKNIQGDDIIPFNQDEVDKRFFVGASVAHLNVGGFPNLDAVIKGLPKYIIESYRSGTLPPELYYDPKTGARPWALREEVAE